MQVTGLASRAEALAEHNDCIPRGATSNLLSTRKPKLQQTYSKRVSKPSTQPTIPSQEHFSIDTPSLYSLPPEYYASRASTLKKCLMSALDSNRVQRTASQPSVPSTELSSTNTDLQDSLQPQRHNTRTKKRSISDFFRPVRHNSRSSSPIRRHHLSSPIPSHLQIIPSSPPSSYSADETENYLPNEKRASKMKCKENIPLKGNGSDGRKRKDEDDKEKVEANEKVRRNNARVFIGYTYTTSRTTRTRSLSSRMRRTASLVRTMPLPPLAEWTVLEIGDHASADSWSSPSPRS